MTGLTNAQVALLAAAITHKRPVDKPGNHLSQSPAEEYLEWLDAQDVPACGNKRPEES